MKGSGTLAQRMTRRESVWRSPPLSRTPLRPKGTGLTLSPELPGMAANPRLDNARKIKAAHGDKLTARTWQTEAAMRMLMNNLDEDVAEKPGELVVYGGIGRAARDWACYDKIVATLKTLSPTQTLLVQSGKPVGVFETHADAPRVLIANSNLVGKWSDWERFHELDRKGLMMYGQMTAG